MKNLKRTLIALLLVLTALLSLAGCNGADQTEATEPVGGEEIAAEGLWKTATYRKNATVGEGSKSVEVDVEAEGKKITITVKTDASTLGKALFDAKIINDASFFDTCNGIKADWDADKAYWAFYVGKDYASVGVDAAEISGGEHYRLVYSK